MIQFIQAFTRIVFNFMYSVDVPGIGVPFIYFFVAFSTLFILVSIFRRVLYSPHIKNYKPNVRGSKNADAS